MDLAVKTFKDNAEKACKVLLHAIPKIAEEEWDEDVKKNEVWSVLLQV